MKDAVTIVGVHISRQQGQSLLHVSQEFRLKAGAEGGACGTPCGHVTSAHPPFVCMWKDKSGITSLRLCFPQEQLKHAHCATSLRPLDTNRRQPANGCRAPARMIPALSQRRIGKGPVSR